MGLDPNLIGTMGSAAGGHLTIMGATSSQRRSYWPIDDLDKLPCNVQWAVAIYPAYALTDGAESKIAQGAWTRWVYPWGADVPASEVPSGIAPLLAAELLEKLQLN